MKKLILILATVVSAAGTVFANVTIRTDGAPIIPGSVVHLSWQRPSPTQTSDVDVSYDLGSTWIEIATDLDRDSMDWTIPAVKFEALQFRVRLDKPLQSTYQIPTSYRRPGSTTSKAWSPNGDTLITIETTDSTCHVLRTDLVNGRTEKIWGSSDVSGKGRITANLQYAFIIATGGTLTRIDLSDGSTTELSRNAILLEVVDEIQCIAFHDVSNYLHYVHFTDLDTLRSWNLGNSTNVKKMYECGGRIVIQNQLNLTLIYQIDRQYSMSTFGLLERLGGSDSLLWSSNGIYHIRDLELTCPLPSSSKVVAVSGDDRYVITKTIVLGAYVDAWLIDIRSNERTHLPASLHNSASRFVLPGADSCILISDDERSYFIKVRGNSIDTLNSLSYGITDVLGNGDHAFVSESVVATFRNGNLRSTVHSPYISQLSPSPDGRHSILDVSGKPMLYDRVTDSFSPVIDQKGTAFYCKWSADGSVAMVSNGIQFGLFRMPTKQFNCEYTAATVDRIKRVYTSRDLSVACLVVNDNQLKVWHSKDHTIRSALLRNINLIYEVSIITEFDMLLIRAKVNGNTNQQLLRYSIADEAEAHSFEYKDKTAPLPFNLQSHVIDTTAKSLITRETVTGGVIRISSWSFNGACQWTKQISINQNTTYGPQLFCDGRSFMLRTPTKDYMYDLDNGGYLFESDQNILGEISGGKAYISVGASTTMPGGAAIFVSSTSMNEKISIKDSLRSVKGVAYSAPCVYYASVEAWVVITNADALLSTDTVLCSNMLPRGIITSVSQSYGAIDIHVEHDVQPFNCELRLYDLQGRRLFEQDGIVIQEGTNSVYVEAQDLPRQFIVLISIGETVLFRQLMQR